MTLTEILNKVGNENLRVQFIRESLISFKETKHDLEINFATEKQNKPIDGCKKVGIVVWIDAEKYSEAIK
jgi:hypothetical protein